MEPTAGKTKGKHLWKRRGWWAFLFLNLACLLLIIPLLQSVPSLVGIWWHTRSRDHFKSEPAQAGAPIHSARARATPSNSTPALVDPQTLTNKMGAIQDLPDSEIHKIIALKFGENKQVFGDPTVFDQNAAVFEKIKSFTTNIDGKLTYAYEVVWVDPHGNRDISVDYFDEPNLEYERGKATLELIDQNPQLKRIYQAMSYVLAEKSLNNSVTNANASVSETH
jgi:hypothetical protein